MLTSGFSAVTENPDETSATEVLDITKALDA
jgi:hypothetical protein